MYKRKLMRSQSACHVEHIGLSVLGLEVHDACLALCPFAIIQRTLAFLANSVASSSVTESKVIWKNGIY